MPSSTEQPSKSPTEKTQTPTSAMPTSPSETALDPKSVNSPEFRKEMLDELKDWVKKGHATLAPGNTIDWTPEELAAMTTEECARCAQPAK